MKGQTMSYAITKGDITVEELEPRVCEEDGCDHPATHWIGIDIRAVGVKTILDGIYCKLHAQVSVERIRDGLLGDEPPTEAGR